MDTYYIIGIIVGVLIVGIIALVFVIKRTKLAKSQHEQMQRNLPVILEGERKANSQLLADGVDATNHYSSLGYSFVDYRTKYNAPDNIHLIMDDTHRQLIFYMLLPYEYKKYDYSQIVKCELFVNNGKVDVTSTAAHVGTSIGGVGLGTTISNGEARQQVTAMNVLVYFADGQFATVSFIDNIGCYTDENRYTAALLSAKSFCVKVDNIIEACRKQ